jgi:hypothetical protein
MLEPSPVLEKHVSKRTESFKLSASRSEDAKKRKLAGEDISQTKKPSEKKKMRKKDLSIIIERSGHGNLFSAY